MDRKMLTLRKVLRENDFETFIEKIENLKIAPLLLRRQYCPAIDDRCSSQHRYVYFKINR